MKVLADLEHNNVIGSVNGVQAFVIDGDEVKIRMINETQWVVVYYHGDIIGMVRTSMVENWRDLKAAIDA